MDISTKVKCPYCGREQGLKVSTQYGKEIVCCGAEDGGCDKYYAVFWVTNVSTEAHTIGGQEC